MSIIDELLVFLDDKDDISLTDIVSSLSGKSRQAISSALGRLASKGWVLSKLVSGEKQYKISNIGRKIITSNLNIIREYESIHWDGIITMIVFSIPENKRKLRDMFRRHLVDLGFARLHNDLWISFWKKRILIEKIVEELHINKYCTIIEINELSKSDQINIAENLIYNKIELYNSYKEFISKSDKYFKSSRDGFHARLLVYNYAKALGMDPNVPTKIISKNIIPDKAYKTYLKIRPYCYK